MQSMNLNGMQVIVLSQPGLQNQQQTSRTMKPRLVKQLIGLGVVHILNGVFCIIFQSISLEKTVNPSNGFRYFSLVPVGYGFWTGLPFLVTGIIGISAGIRNGNCQVVAFNILSIISAMLAAVLVIIAVISAFIVDDYRRNRSGTTSTFYTEMMIVVVMESMLAAVGLLEGIICIWSAIVCCIIGVCNCCLPYPTQTQPMIISAEQQAALMSNQMFTSNQQQSTVGFYPQQQTVQYNRLQRNAPPYAANNYMSGSAVEGSYTGLNTGIRRSLPPVNMDAATGNTISLYEELHEYDEIIS